MNGVKEWIHTLRGYSLTLWLGLFNIILVGLWFGLLTPEVESLDLEFRRLKAANINFRNQVELNSQTLEAIDENRIKFSSLRERGFIDPQNRLGVTRLLDRLREVHGLTSIYYEIYPEVLYDDRATRATGFNIVSTQVKVLMRGLFDADLVEFTQAIIDEFPGQVRPLSFSLERLGEPTEKALRILRDGKLVDFIGGELTFEWNTLRPISKKTSG